MSQLSDRQIAQPATPAWHLFVPKLITVLKEDYGLAQFRGDFLAGLTVAIVALPLAMALAIASGTTPDKGLITAVVAGFIISALGGSRFQIGGPTGAFVVVVFNVIQAHGYDGLVLATLMAGAMLIVTGLFRLGTWIKYIPEPVVIGFTAGIAVIIASSQIKDFFGLSVERVPAEFAHKIAAFWAAADTMSPLTLSIAAGALGLIILLRRRAPRLPAFLIAVGVASLLVFVLGLQVDTIGSRFGGIPNMLPAPSWPEVSLARLAGLLQGEFPLAFLDGVQSLLSAMVADGMTGRRHRSNCELTAQGVANVASALFGGMPATGAIARTATNIRSGAKTPVAGMMHAVFVLLFMVLFAPLAIYIPLASLAAVLLIVAFNMSEIDKVRFLWSAPPGDKAVLLITFGLTVFVDLTVAIEVGVVLAAILFMHRMAQVVTIERGQSLLVDDLDDLADPGAQTFDQRQDIPDGIEVYQLRGPIFFGAAAELGSILDDPRMTPKVLIVRMREVPLIDSTAVAVLRAIVKRCKARGITIVVTGVQDQPRLMLEQMGFGESTGNLTFAANFREAVEFAKTRI